LPLSLDLLVKNESVRAFLYERARGYFQEQGYTANELEAVLSLHPSRLDLVPRQLEAVRAFAALPEAESLAAANKRSGNIRKQAGEITPQFDETLFVVAEERALQKAYSSVKGDVEAACEGLHYTNALRRLASLRGPVDA